MIGDVVPVETWVGVPSRCRNVVEHIAVVVHPRIIPIVELSKDSTWSWKHEMLFQVRRELALLGTVGQVAHESDVEIKNVAPVYCVRRKSRVDLQVAAADSSRIERDTGKVVIADVAGIDELQSGVSALDSTGHARVHTALAMYGM